METNCKTVPLTGKVRRSFEGEGPPPGYTGTHTHQDPVIKHSPGKKKHRTHHGHTAHTTIITGDHSEKDQIVFVKIAKYIGFCVYGKSYLLWSPVTMTRHPPNTVTTHPRTSTLRTTPPLVEYTRTQNPPTHYSSWHTLSARPQPHIIIPVAHTRPKRATIQPSELRIIKCHTASPIFHIETPRIYCTYQICRIAVVFRYRLLCILPIYLCMCRKRTAHIYLYIYIYIYIADGAMRSYIFLYTATLIYIPGIYIYIYYIHTWYVHIYIYIYIWMLAARSVRFGKRHGRPVYHCVPLNIRAGHPWYVRTLHYTRYTLK